MYNYISDLLNIICSEANTSEKASFQDSATDLYSYTYSHIFWYIKKKFSV